MCKNFILIGEDFCLLFRGFTFLDTEYMYSLFIYLKWNDTRNTPSCKKMKIAYTKLMQIGINFYVY